MLKKPKKIKASWQVLYLFNGYDFDYSFVYILHALIDFEIQRVHPHVKINDQLKLVKIVKRLWEL